MDRKPNANGSGSNSNNKRSGGPSTSPVSHKILGVGDNPTQNDRQKYQNSKHTGQSNKQRSHYVSSGSGSASEGSDYEQSYRHGQSSPSNEGYISASSLSNNTFANIKDFSRHFKALESRDPEAAKKAAIEYLESGLASENSIWKIYLDLADLAKRENDFDGARGYYIKAAESDPSQPQCWLDFAKMEDDRGNTGAYRDILFQGLEYCPASEQLLAKLLKYEEKHGSIEAARVLIGKQRQSDDPEKVKKVILEGALLEARAGDINIARKAFKYLMSNYPSAGTVFTEAAKFESKNEDYNRAIDICTQGALSIPKYSPLSQLMIQFEECREGSQSFAIENGISIYRPTITANDHVEDILKAFFGLTGAEFDISVKNYRFTRTHEAIKRAVPLVNSELAWKLHFEAAQLWERSEYSGAEGEGLSYSKATSNLMSLPNWLDQARKCYVASARKCGDPIIWKIWLAGARSEVAGLNYDVALKLIAKGAADAPQKYQSAVILDHARVEELRGDIKQAREILRSGIEKEGSDWKTYYEAVQFEARYGNIDEAIKLAEDALKIHEGTGRLWALLIQLYGSRGSIEQEKCLIRSIESVPKSGEVWCEAARFRMNPLESLYSLETASRYLDFAIQFTPQYGDSFIEAIRLRLVSALTDVHFVVPKIANDDVISRRSYLESVDTSDIERNCMNADPNYGTLWFHCKRNVHDPAKKVLRVAKRILVSELSAMNDIYQTKSKEVATKKMTGLKMEFPSWRFFSTGMASVNFAVLTNFSNVLSEKEKRKVLFGSDSIII